MLRAILAAWILTGVALAEQTVEGRVVNSATGAGIPGVTVNLLQSEKTAYSATTDTQGNFGIEAVKQGSYTANYEADNFWPIPGLLDGPPPQFQVTTAADPVRLEFKMVARAKISGRVTDATGKPVAKASVWLRWQRTGYGVADRRETDEKGEYSVADLVVPGRWLVSAGAPSSWPPPESHDDQRLGWAQTFYPGVTDPKLAVKVTVEPGGDLWNVDIKLAAVPVHRIRGRVFDAGGDPVPKARVLLGKGFDSPTFRQETKGDGMFEFGSIVDDEWRLSVAVDNVE